MKIQKVFILLLFFTSCNQTEKRRNSNFQLVGKTFSINSEQEYDIDIIDFQDSTFNILGKSHTQNWKLSYYENVPFLIFERTTSGIRKVNDSVFSLHRIDSPNDSITMTLLKSKWKTKMLYGTWIEERYIGTDSSDFPPPPLEKIKTNWPPSYKISENKIEYDFYRKSESDIRISNNGEFISMNLNNPILYENEEKYWHITFLSDSIMVIDRNSLIPNHSRKTSQRSYDEGGIRLIKKRFANNVYN